MSTPSYLLYGHRGCPAKLPENTLASFEQALRDGADGLETDLHRTADGHFVLSHDPDGRRTAGRPDLIRDSSLAEVKRWDVGWGFAGPDGGRPHLGQGHTVPCLTEVLTAFPAVPLSIDIKPEDPGVVAPLVTLLRDLGAAPRVTLGSFHTPQVRAARRMGYPGPTALTRPEVALLRLLPLPGRLAGLFLGGTAAMIPPRSGAVSLDGRRFIRRCRRVGLRVDYWVVDDAAQAEALLAKGATGIVSDDPARLRPVVEAWRGRR